jgi:broad specificity phosphatase PhoE
VTEVILVRHAATSWSGQRFCGWSDPPLSAAGHRAAVGLARSLAGELSPRTRVITSPSLRARTTADEIVAAAGLDRPTVDERWMEAHFGDVEGRSFEDVELAYPAISARILAADVAIDWPGGETIDAFVARVASACSELAAALLPDQVLVVSHAGPIRLALAMGGEPGGAAIAPPQPASVVRIDSVALAAGASGWGLGDHVLSGGGWTP